MKLKLFYLLIYILLWGCNSTKKPVNLVDYVNPLIGTAPSNTISALNHGYGLENNAQVVPFVTAPFAMTNWTPQTRFTETKCEAPYYFTDSVIQGFRGSHWLSGSCVQDYGSMSIMPVFGSLKCLPEDRGSFFNKESEIATPNFYKVTLDDYAVDVEMTATHRCGLFRFTFIEEGTAHIVVNPNSDESQGFVRIIPERNEIIGYNPVHRIYQGNGQNAGFSGYFVARFNRSFDNYGIYQASNTYEKETQVSDLENLGGYASFNVSGSDLIEVMVGTSFTSIENARMNLDSETENTDFDSAVRNLKNTWESTLGKVVVEGTNEDEKVKFYTAMYHSLLHPRTFNDVDGSYVSFAGGAEVLNSGNSNYYVDFSMWDTYRALHPLFNLLLPETNGDMMNSILAKAEQGGWLPIFPLWNSYTSAMIGDHAIAAVADAYLKNNIDLSEEDYQLLLQNAFNQPESFEDYKQGKGRRALTSYMTYGYVPLEDDVNESFHKKEQVSRTLEYAYDDFALSQIAAKRGDSINAGILYQRALNYRNVFSIPDSCVRGRYADGRFIEEFDKLVRQFYITEGTPWQYTWYVPHDINGLMQLMGGDDGFNANLDRFHLAGQYWHGNEPGHQILFLYNYSGQPWKTQELVGRICEEEYGIGPGGLSGNDDAGQMSAWYVFASLGFYPVCPSVPEYAISGPRFDRITLSLENENKLEIIAPGASSGKKFIQSVWMNGELYEKNFFNHFDLMKGGTIEFEMGDEPNYQWGIDKSARPFSLSDAPLNE